MMMHILFSMKTLQDAKKSGARLITISCDGKTVYYHFFLDGNIVTLRKAAKNLNSARPLFKGAELYEREIMEKFGVSFRGHTPKKLFT